MKRLGAAQFRASLASVTDAVDVNGAIWVPRDHPANLRVRGLVDGVDGDPSTWAIPTEALAPEPKPRGPVIETTTFGADARTYLPADAEQDPFPGTSSKRPARIQHIAPMDVAYRPAPKPGKKK